MLTLLLPGKKSTAFSLGSVVLAGVLTASAFTAVPAVLAPAPAAAADYPSWEEVEQAKRSAGAKADQAAEIEELLDELAADAGTLGTAAVQASSDARRAAADVDAGSRAVDVLSAQRAEAAGAAAALTEQMGALAAQTYKTGGMDSNLIMLLDADAGAGALDRLAALQGISGRTDSLQARAAAAESVLGSLEEREAAALKTREESAAEARRLEASARAAATEADAAVREVQERSAVLLEQLAALRSTSAAVEAERLKGVEAEQTYIRQQQEAEEAARKAQAAKDAAGGTTESPVLPPSAGPDPVINPIPPPLVPAPRPVTEAPPLPSAPPAPQPAPTPEPAPAPGPAPVPAPSPGPVDDPAGAQAYAAGRLGAYGWGQDQLRCLINLWQRESGWRTSANNPYSGAYGIPQSLPGDKMASIGPDWRTNYRTQIEWGLGYIQSRYGSPCSAWQHSEEKNWY